MSVAYAVSEKRSEIRLSRRQRRTTPA